MNAKASLHTSGPWHVGGKPGNPIIYGPDGFAVANATVFHGAFKEAETDANARLIAEVPEMLEALKKALARICDQRLPSSLGERGNDALRVEIEGLIARAETRAIA